MCGVIDRKVGEILREVLNKVPQEKEIRQRVVLWQMVEEYGFSGVLLHLAVMADILALEEKNMQRMGAYKTIETVLIRVNEELREILKVKGEADGGASSGVSG